MKVIPAIDLMNGQVVRLYKGDPNQKTVYSDNPIEIAKKWEANGADMLHLVDLDATLGRGSNLLIIKKILEQISIPIQVAGGLRDEATINDISKISHRVVLGTLAFKDKSTLKKLLSDLGPEKIVISVDNIDGQIVIHGWQKETGIKLIDAIFIPYYYISETMKPIPEGKGFYGGKWHWMQGVSDCSSNHQVLEDAKLIKFIEASEKIDLPIVFEEEFSFTESFVRKTKNLKIIIPHLGMLGGNPIDFLSAFKTRENVYFDTALASSDTIMKFIEKIGHGRILFGSDIPFGTMKWELEKVLSLPIGDEKKEWILSKNLKRLIRWE